MPSIKDFISKERLNPKLMSELERIDEEEEKCFKKDIIKSMTLENLKLYVLLVMVLKLTF